jgi:hypothetical protein
VASTEKIEAFLAEPRNVTMPGADPPGTEDGAVASKEAVLRVHEKAGHPTEEIYELPVEID